MTLGNAEKLEEKGLKLLSVRHNKKGIEIYKELFCNWNTKSDLSQKIYPHLYARIGKRSWSKNKIHRAINDYVKAFDNLKWLDSREKKQVSPGKNPTEFKATLKPYFEYLKKIKGLKLTKEQEKCIGKSIEKSRQKEGKSKFKLWKEMLNQEKGFFESLDLLTKQWIFHSLVGRFSDIEDNMIFDKKTKRMRFKTEKEKTTMKKIIKKSDYIKMVKLAKVFFDKFSLHILRDSLIYKAFYYSNENLYEKKEKAFFKVLNTLDNTKFKQPFLE